MRCPFATWQPVGNYTAVTIAHLGVVIHVTAGESNPWGWFNNPTSQASSHFFIGNGQGGTPDGALFQYVDTDLKAWAEAAGNTSYVSVETEGEPTDPLTPAQIATFAKLYNWLHAQYGIPYVITDTPGQQGFITHGDGGVAWGNHPDCPGPLRSTQRQAILTAAQPKPPQPAPISHTEKDMIAHDNATNGYWVARPNATIYAYSGAPYLGPLPKYTSQWGIGTASNPIVGIVSDGAGGFTLACDNGGSTPTIYHIPSTGQYAK